jgi:hypothetical protein
VTIAFEESVAVLKLDAANRSALVRSFADALRRHEDAPGVIEGTASELAA